MNSFIKKENKEKNIGKKNNELRFHNPDQKSGINLLGVFGGYTKEQKESDEFLKPAGSPVLCCH